MMKAKTNNRSSLPPHIWKVVVDTLRYAYKVSDQGFAPIKSTRTKKADDKMRGLLEQKGQLLAKLEEQLREWIILAPHAGRTAKKIPLILIIDTLAELVRIVDDIMNKQET
jgi:hypothetical protein